MKNLIGPVAVAVLAMAPWATVPAHQPDGSAKDTWYRSDGQGFISLYSYSKRAYVKVSDSEEILEYGYEILPEGLVIIAAQDRQLLPASWPTPNTMVTSGPKSERVFHRISGDWFSDAGSTKILRLSPRYLTVEYYTPSGDWEGDYRFDGRTLHLLDENGRVARSGPVELSGEELVFDGERYSRLGDFVDARGLIAKRLIDGTVPTVKGQWADAAGRIWKFANEYFEVSSGGKRLIVGLYTPSSDRIDFRSSSISDGPFSFSLAAELKNANTLQLGDEHGSMTLYYQGDFNISIGVYDIDKYRVPADYFRTRPYGGYMSWCLSQCDPVTEVESHVYDVMPRGGAANYRSEWVPLHRVIEEDRQREKEREEEERRRLFPARP